MFGKSERVLKIVQAGDPVLRQEARALSPDEIRSRPIQDLVRNMRATMRKAPGVGLAAPQVGEPLRLFVVEDRPEFQQKQSADELMRMERHPVPFYAVFNPVLTVDDDAPCDFFEGCLSVGDFRALVRRARAVRVLGLDENAAPIEVRAIGWHARIVQHEYDHLQGMLCIDRMEARSFSTLENFSRHWAHLPVDELRRQLRIED